VNSSFGAIIFLDRQIEGNPSGFHSPSRIRSNGGRVVQERQRAMTTQVRNSENDKYERKQPLWERDQKVKRPIPSM
jgi:hypothetical protein